MNDNLSVPKTIQELLQNMKQPEPVEPSQPPARGQLRLVEQITREQEHLRRLALVINTNDEESFAEIALIHPYAELATDADLIVPLEHTNTPYQVVVQTDLRGVVWLNQLGSVLGNLKDNVFDAASSVATKQSLESDRFGSGPPLRGIADRRWQFKESEGSVLRKLVTDCTASLLDA